MSKESRDSRPEYGPTTRGFRDLRVWQGSMDLVEAVYLVTQDFPRDEVYGLTSQMRRAAVSVPSNIAEGQSRQHLREYLHHLSMAQGSLGELETQIELAGRLGYTSNEPCRVLLEQLGAVGRQLSALRSALQRKLLTPTDLHESSGVASRPPSRMPQNLEPGT